MLAFILPLKPKSQSKNWEKDCALLKSTVNSLLNQQSANYQIYIVYTNNPELDIDSEKIHLIEFPFPFTSFSDIPEFDKIINHFNNDTLMLERRWDKSRKIFYGCKAAKEAGCKYLMSVDADDLISHKLVGYIDNITQVRDISGFYIDKGFLYNIGKKRMIKINSGMQNFNGSTHIIKSEFINIPDFERGKWIDYNLFTSHGWIVHRLREELGIILEAIPFPAVIYVAHNSNISKVNQLNFKDKLKRLVKNILYSEKINEDLRNEFSIK